MLDNPNLYKMIFSSLREQVTPDYANRLLSDASKIDFQHVEKMNKKNYMIVIEKLIKQCPINNDYVKHKRELQEYTQKYIDEAYPLLKPETMINLLNNYKTKESINLIYPPLQSFILYVELIRQLYFYIQERYIRKSKDNKIILTHYFIQYSLELLNGICSLMLGENYNSAISVYRTFYENYIIFNYLQIHQNLTEAFIDHARIDHCLLNIEYAKVNKREVPTEIQNLYNHLILKYGEDFKDDYGWVKSLIPDRYKRNLKTMFEESKLGESFNYFYKISCKYSHSTALSLMTRPNFTQLTGFLLEIAEITNNEFNVLFNNISIVSTKERALLEDWLGVSTDNMRKEIIDSYKEETGS